MSEIENNAISNEATATEVVNETSAPTEEATTNTEATENVEVQAAESNSNDFLSGLGEELSGVKALQNFKSAEDLAKSYLNANQLLGKRMADLSAEDAAHLASLQGKPASADEYTLPEELNAEALSWYKDAALKAGLTQDQAKAVADEYIMLERSKAESLEVEDKLRSEEWVGELKTEFGSAFDKQVEVAKRGVKEFGGDEVADILNRTGLGDNPAIVKMFAKIGRELLEDTVVHADKSNAFGITPDEARKQISALRSNKDFNDAYFNQRNPGHKAAVAQLKELYSKIS